MERNDIPSNYQPPVQWQPGDIANGHQLGADGKWRPLPLTAVRLVRTPELKWPWYLPGWTIAAIFTGAALVLLVIVLLIPPTIAALS